LALTESASANLLPAPHPAFPLHVCALVHCDRARVKTKTRKITMSAKKAPQKKTSAKARDLKPKKDAKGGMKKLNVMLNP
jgi:hypothetical protein